MSIESLIPKIDLPTVSTLLGETPQGSSGQDRMIEKLAEQQLAEEKDSEMMLLKILDYLGRPQAAVAGVMTDLIDGGDFSPLDRVSHALMGEERYRMKNFIDVVAPGKWSNMRLPNWMGAHDVDIFKEGVGFIGDVFTDPLMMVQTFATLGNVSRKAGNLSSVGFHGAKLGKRVQPFHEIAPEFRTALDASPELRKSLVKASKDRAQSMGIATHTANAFVGQHYRLSELKLLYDEVLQYPEKFKEAFLSTADGTEFWRAIQPHLGKDMYAMAPKMADRLTEGSATAIAVRTPLLARIAGVADKQISMVPQIADEWAAGLVKGLDKMTAGALRSPAGQAVKTFINNTFTAGTGSKEGDMVLAAVGKNDYIRGKEVDEVRKQIRKMFKHTDKAYRDKVLEYVRKPVHFHAGAAGVYFKDRAIPKDVMEPVEYITGLMKERHAEINHMPGMSVNYVGVKNLKPRKAYDMLNRSLVSQNYDAARLIPWQDLHRTAKAAARTKLKGMDPGMAFSKKKEVLRSQKGKYQKNVEVAQEAVLKENMMRAQWDLENLIPHQEMGYMPRKLSEAGRQIWADLIHSGKLLYKGKPAEDVWTSAGMPRKLSDDAVDELNRRAREGDLPLPADFMDEVFEYARTNLKGKQRNAFQRLMGDMDAGEISLYIDDPVQLTTQYIIDTNNKLTLQGKLNGLTKHFAMRLDDIDYTPAMGERRVILSPEGMSARYGDDWKELMGEDAVIAYEAAIKEAQLGPEGHLGNLFLASDEHLIDTLIKQHAGVPVHAIPGDIMEAMNRFAKVSGDPLEHTGLMRAAQVVTNVWKQWSLAPFPGYHCRNWANGLWQAYLGDSLNLKSYEAAWDTMRAMPGAFRVLPKKGLKSPIKDMQGKIITKNGYNGQSISADEVYKWAQEQGVFSQGFLSAEMLHMTKAEATQEARKLAQKFKMKHDEAFEFLFGIGNDAENVHRFAHFIDRVRKGDTAQSAAMSVKKNFYNYGELSHVEKKWLRLVFPFYSWSRKNLPRQFEALIREPGKLAQAGRITQFMTSEEARNMDRSLLPKWVNKNVGVPARVNPETGDMDVRMWGAWVGWTDLRNWTNMDPYNATVTTAFDQLNPIAKLITEHQSNHSFYTEKPIERYPGEPYGMPFLGMDLSKKWVHVFKTWRPASEANKLMYGKSVAGEIPFGQRVMNFMSLKPKVASFDLEDLETSREFEVATRKGEINRTIRRTKAIDNEAAAKIIDKMKKQTEKVKR